MKNMELKLYPICYYGNKYNETKKYLFNIDYSKYDIIAEPFGGVYGFTRAIYSKCNKKTIFLINDIDTGLIKLHNFFKQNKPETIQKILNDYIIKHNINNMNDKELKNFIKNYYYQHTEDFLFFKYNCEGLYCADKLQKKINNNIKNLIKYKNFFSRCTFFNMRHDEFIKMINENELYKNKSKLIYFDPPYFDSCNKNYNQLNDNKIEENIITIGDNTKIYIDILESLKTGTHSILIINKNYLIDHIYKDYIKESYIKTYSNGCGKKRNMKRRAQHNIIRNF